MVGTIQARIATRIAALLTAATAVTLLLVVPIGTLLALVWLLGVRKRETSAL